MQPYDGYLDVIAEGDRLLLWGDVVAVEMTLMSLVRTDAVAGAASSLRLLVSSICSDLETLRQCYEDLRDVSLA